MGTCAKRFLAGFLSISLVGSSSAPGLAAPARGASPPPVAAPATPPVVHAAQPAPAVQEPPAAETPKQRKAREKAEAKARKKAERERERALDPNREKRKEKRKKVVGCVAGAALGIVAGILLSNRRNRGEAVVAGAVAGCAAGWALGGALKGDDKERLDHFVNEDVALRDGEPVRTWIAPNSGETITLQQTDAGYKPIEAVFNIAPGIQFPQPGVLVEGRAMRVTTALRLRGGPSTSDAIVGSFAPNEIVQVIGQTPDQQWALIGENNVVVGYASKTYLSTSLAIPSQAPIRFAAMKRTPPPRVRPVRGRAPPAPVVVASAPPQVARVQASTRCKSFVASHGSNRSTQQRCAQPNATAWA